MYIVYVAYRRLKGWTNWAEFCCGHSGVAAGVKAKKVEIFFNFYVKTFLFLFPRATPCFYLESLFNFNCIERIKSFDSV